MKIYLYLIKQNPKIQSIKINLISKFRNIIFINKYKKRC